MSTGARRAAPVDLAFTAYGDPDPRRETVVVLHGLFGSGRNWMTIARRLAATHRVLAPDLRNHGASPWATAMTYPAMAADVAGLLVHQANRPVTLVGHSMGGKAAMSLALARPGLVRRLVVVDVAPVTYESTFAPYARAMQEAHLEGVTRRSQVEEQLTEAVPDAAVRAFLLQNLVLEKGGARWRVNLPVLEAAMETISGFPEVEAGVEFRKPVLFVAGERSSYLSPGQEPVVRRLFPQAEVTVVRGAGHWVHAEQPDEFLQVMESVLARRSLESPPGYRS
jgi:esterase